MKVRILGCGTSSGVPRIGNDWGQCDPENPRNLRSRASIMISLGGYRLIVDTSPDMRLQLLDAGIGEVDGVIWTHEHADHTHGLDDLRQIMHLRGSAVPVSYTHLDVYKRQGPGAPSRIAGDLAGDGSQW